MVTLLALFTGFLIGIVVTLIVGLYQHQRELRDTAQNPDPKIISEVAAYIVEHHKLKELEK